jgi:hypothetical protein
MVLLLSVRLSHSLVVGPAEAGRYENGDRPGEAGLSEDGDGAAEAGRMRTVFDDVTRLRIVLE